VSSKVTTELAITSPWKV